MLMFSRQDAKNAKKRRGLLFVIVKKGVLFRDLLGYPQSHYPISPTKEKPS